MLPGGHRGVTLRALHRAELGRAEASGGALRIDVIERPDPTEIDRGLAEQMRAYRAVIESILEARDRGRVIALPALRRGAGRAGRHGRLLARPVVPPEARAARDARRRRAPREGDRLGARRARRDRAEAAHPRRRHRGHGEEPARVRPAPPARRHPQGARRGRRDRRDRPLPRAHRRGGRCPRRPARRPSASSAASRPAPPAPEGSTIRTYLDWLLAVPWGETSDERNDVNAARDDPRGRPRRPEGRQGAHPRVPRRAQVPPRARDRGRARRA